MSDRPIRRHHQARLRALTKAPPCTMLLAQVQSLELVLAPNTVCALTVFDPVVCEADMFKLLHLLLLRTRMRLASLSRLPVQAHYCRRFPVVHMLRPLLPLSLLLPLKHLNMRTKKRSKTLTPRKKATKLMMMTTMPKMQTTKKTTKTTTTKKRTTAKVAAMLLRTIWSRTLLRQPWQPHYKKLGFTLSPITITCPASSHLICPWYTTQDQTIVCRCMCVIRYAL